MIPAMFVLFGRKINLEQQMDLWGKPAANYDPELPPDASWNVDEYEITLNGGRDPETFERAAQNLFRYQFYPAEVLTHASDFARAGRPLRTGDRIIQRIHILPGLLDVITLNQVVSVVYEAGRRGFTYRTTTRHLEMGEWSATVVRKRTGETHLLVHAISKPGRRLPRPLHRWARALQKRAHQLGLECFQESLREA